MKNAATKNQKLYLYMCVLENKNEIWIQNLCELAGADLFACANNICMYIQYKFSKLKIK